MCPYHASKHSHSWNIDFDTATIGPGPPINSLDPSEYWWLDDSLNIIAIKVAESDVGYPVRIYGTVLARDQQTTDASICSGEAGTIPNSSPHRYVLMYPS